MDRSVQAMAARILRRGCSKNSPRLLHLLLGFPGLVHRNGPQSLPTDRELYGRNPAPPRTERKHRTGLLVGGDYRSCKALVGQTTGSVGRATFGDDALGHGAFRNLTSIPPLSTWLGAS